MRFSRERFNRSKFNRSGGRIDIVVTASVIVTGYSTTGKDEDVEVVFVKATGSFSPIEWIVDVPTASAISTPIYGYSETTEIPVEVTPFIPSIDWFVEIEASVVVEGSSPVSRFTTVVKADVLASVFQAIDWNVILESDVLADGRIPVTLDIVVVTADVSVHGTMYYISPTWVIVIDTATAVSTPILPGAEFDIVTDSGDVFAAASTPSANVGFLIIVPGAT